MDALCRASLPPTATAQFYSRMTPAVVMRLILLAFTGSMVCYRVQVPPGIIAPSFIKRINPHNCYRYSLLTSVAFNATCIGHNVFSHQFENTGGPYTRCNFDMLGKFSKRYLICGDFMPEPQAEIGIWKVKPFTLTEKAVSWE